MRRVTCSCRPATLPAACPPMSRRPKTAGSQAAEGEVDVLIALVKTARLVREEAKISGRVPLELIVRTRDAATSRIVESVKSRAAAMANLSRIDAGTDAAKPEAAVTKLAGEL